MTLDTPQKRHMWNDIIEYSPGTKSCWGEERQFIHEELYNERQKWLGELPEMEKGINIYFEELEFEMVLEFGEL